MKLKRWISILSVLSFVAIAFNNCSSQKNQAFEGFSAKGNGDFYSGKLYGILNSGLCADGSSYRAIIRVFSAIRAQVVRDQCQSLSTPQDIPGDSITISADQESIQYQSISYGLIHNLVENGSFENGLAGFQVLGGSPLLTNDASAGSSAVSTQGGDGWSWIQQGVDPVLLVPGKTYTLRATAKIFGGNDPVHVAFKGDNNVILASLNFNSETYQVQEVSFVAPAGLTWSVFYIEMINRTSTSAFVDDVSLIENP